MAAVRCDLNINVKELYIDKTIKVVLDVFWKFGRLSSHDMTWPQFSMRGQELGSCCSSWAVTKPSV